MWPADPAHGFTLPELYRETGADTVELVVLDDGRQMILDEDGKARRRLPNMKASQLLYNAGKIFGDWDCVVGPVLVCERGEVK